MCQARMSNAGIKGVLNEIKIAINSQPSHKTKNCMKLPLIAGQDSWAKDDLEKHMLGHSCAHYLCCLQEDFPDILLLHRSI